MTKAEMFEIAGHLDEALVSLWYRFKEFWLTD